MINFFMYANSRAYPFIILVSSIQSIEEEEELNNNFEKIFDFLFKRNLINLNCILIFNVYKAFNEKKEFFIHKGPTAMNPEIIGHQNLEKIVYTIIKDCKSDYEINMNNSDIGINKNSKNLNFLCNYW